MEDKVSIVIPVYNGENYIKKCIESLKAQTYNPIEIIAVENNSTDNSLKVLKSINGIKIIESKSNIGYAGGVDLGFMNAKGKYIATINQDATADKIWIENSIEIIKTRKNVGAVNPKIIIAGTNKINTCGTSIHKSGLTFCRGLNEPESNFSTEEILSTMSGCAFLTTRNIYNQSRGLDRDFFGYLEDTDLSLRIRQYGFDIILDPNSAVYHDYTTNENEWKFYQIQKNRIMMILKNYETKTIMKYIPYFIFAELLSALYSLYKGPRFIKSNMSAYFYIIKNFRKIMQKRKNIQKTRKISDKEIHKTFKSTINPIKIAKLYGII